MWFVNITMQFRLPIALRSSIFDLPRKYREKYRSCGWRIDFTYDNTALFSVVSIFPVLEREPCKGVMRKASRVSDAWREKMITTLVTI